MHFLGFAAIAYYGSVVFFVMSLIVFFPFTAAFAGDRAIEHAPIGVMADHMHKAGEWMISARQMRMEMKGNKVGHNKVNDIQVLEIFNMHAVPDKLKVVPQTMTMDMTMLGVMFAPNDDLTLMMMTNYIEKKMTANTYAMMNNSRLGSFTTTSEGMGDTTISALFNIEVLPSSNFGAWHGSIGVSVPTGSVKEVDTILTPMNMRQVSRLPYAMQLGSGTYDLKPSLTYVVNRDNYVYGGQINGTLRLDDNSQGYSLGNELTATAWIMKSFSDQVAGALRLDYTRNGTIDGLDTQIDKPIQSAQTHMYGGRRANIGLGINFLGHHGWLSGHRLALELRKPLYEDLNGPQMSQHMSINLGYQHAW